MGPQLADRLVLLVADALDRQVEFAGDLLDRPALQAQPQDALLALIRKHPDLGLAALREMAGQLRELVVLVEDLAFRSVRERLARQLLREAAEGTAVLTHQELAERTATVREIAGRALRQLAQEGLVRLERGRVIVLDRAGLARIVEG